MKIEAAPAIESIISETSGQLGDHMACLVDFNELFNLSVQGPNFADLCSFYYQERESTYEI
jgi:hypothetical protein